MRVLVIANNFPSPAVPQDGIFVLRQLQALQRLGHDFVVMRVLPLAPPIKRRWRAYRQVPDHYVWGGIEALTVRALMLPGGYGVEHLRLQVARRIRREIVGRNIDLVHAQGLVYSGFLASNNGVPSVLTAHGSDTYDAPWRTKGLNRAASRAVLSVDAVVAVSDFVGKNIIALGRDDVGIAYNGADNAVFKRRDREQSRARLGIAPGRPVIVFAAFVDRTKGIFDLASACRHLTNLNPLLLIAGASRDGGVQRDILADELSAGGVETRFLGGLEQTDLAEVFGAADVVTLPSYREGLPTVVSEAMLCGRVTVATRAGGTAEIVKDGVSGFIVEIGDVLGLAARLREVLTNRELRDRFEIAAERFANDHLTWSHNAEQYDRIYRRLVGKRDFN